MVTPRVFGAGCKDPLQSVLEKKGLLKALRVLILKASLPLEG